MRKKGAERDWKTMNPMSARHWSSGNKMQPQAEASAAGLEGTDYRKHSTRAASIR